MEKLIICDDKVNYTWRERSQLKDRIIAKWDSQSRKGPDTLLLATHLSPQHGTLKCMLG